MVNLSNFRVWVNDTETNLPVVNAVVELDWVPSNIFYPDYAITTDQNGFGKRSVSAGKYNVRIRHPKYETKIFEDIYFLECRTWPSPTYFDQVYYIKYVPVSAGVNVTFYIVTDQKRRVRSGHIIFNNEKYGTDWDGKVIVYNVQPNIYSVIFGGRFETSDTVYPWEEFNFELDVVIPDKDITYVVWVEQRVLFEGEPPVEPHPPPVDPWEKWGRYVEWLQKNWKWILTGGVTLYALPHIATIAKAVRRNKVKIIGNNRKKKIKIKRK